MNKEIVLIDELQNEIIADADKYILRFDSGANLSLEFNVKHIADAIVCRAWYGDNEWKPSLEGSCNLILNPYAGDCVWMRPVVLTGKSLANVKVKAVSLKPPQLFACTNDQESLIDSSITSIIVKDKRTKLVFKIELPDNALSPLYRESILISTSKDDIESKHQAISCEPKGANLWVFKHLRS